MRPRPIRQVRQTRSEDHVSGHSEPKLKLEDSQWDPALVAVLLALTVHPSLAEDLSVLDRNNYNNNNAGVDRVPFHGLLLIDKSAFQKISVLGAYSDQVEASERQPFEDL
jgi:hypothetical protein